MLRRFEHEGMLLGRLKHPGIAQIYEAGTVETDQGPLPFLAMELVTGVPLHRHAEDHGLGLRDRLELFAKVCDAVQHAHQRGVIHRDLKPANILVDESGQPKLLDFGIARATDGDLKATTLNTGAGQLLGTVPYMSPEQVAGDPRELDTRSDVYALGVVLYELVTGRLPYDLATASMPEAARIVREQDPVRPALLGREFRGDLEAILLKALEKNRAVRYQAAADLSGDLRAFLRHEPISARRQSGLYQLRKFAARNRRMVGAAAVAVLALLTGTVVSTTMYLRAEAARQSASVDRDRARDAQLLATSRLAEAAEARARAERQAARADRVKAFLLDMFGSINPTRGNGADLTVRAVVDAAAERLRTQLQEEPEVRAEAMTTIGLVYFEMAHLAEAREFLLMAAEIRRQTPGAESPEYAESLLNLAMLNWETPAIAKEALAQCDQAIAIFRKTLGGDDPRTVQALGVRMMIVNELGQGADAWAAMVDAAVPTMLTIVNEADYPEDIAEVIGRTRRLWQAGDKAAVRELLMEYRRKLTQRVADLWAAGDRPGAYEEIRRHYLPLTRAPLFEGLIPRALTSLGQWVQRQDNQPVLVEALLREAVNYGREHPGKQGETCRYSLIALADFLRERGELAEAESWYAQGLRVCRATEGPESEDVAVALFNLAGLRHQAGDDRAAEPFARECTRILKARRPGHADTAASLLLFGEVVAAGGELTEAEAAFRAWSRTGICPARPAGRWPTSRACWAPACSPRARSTRPARS
jgi:tetratricopeptide (TPR) repeat protein